MTTITSQDTVASPQSSLDDALQLFVEKWNDHTGMEFPVTVSQKTKFWRIESNGATLAFVDRSNGDIYKPATNIARASGVRGNIRTSNVKDITDADGNMVHLPRGRPRKVVVESSEN